MPTPTQIALVGVLFAVGASSQVVLPNNQRSKVDNSSAELSQEHLWNGSSRHGAEMKVLFGYYGYYNQSRYRACLAVVFLGQPDLGLGVVRPVFRWHLRIIKIDPRVIRNTWVMSFWLDPVWRMPTFPLHKSAPNWRLMVANYLIWSWEILD